MAKPQVPFEEFVKRLEEANDIDFARLAAFIDGEGCIGITCSPARGKGISKRHSISVSVANTNPLLFEWILATFGGRVALTNRKRINVRTRACWSWQLGQPEAEEILRRCLPYLILKAEQARIALALRALITGSEGRGHATPHSVIEMRDDLRNKIVALNAAKGFGLVQSAKAG